MFKQSDWKLLNGTREFSKIPKFPLFRNTEKVVLNFRKSFPEEILFHSIPTRDFRKFRRMESAQILQNVFISKKDGHDPNPHDCRLNHNKSSKSMEPLSAVKLSKRVSSIESDTPAKYSVFIGDDDCSTISQIREEVNYKVEKWSDTASPF